MSDTSQGDGWWQASDGKWYRPDLHPAHGADVATPSDAMGTPTEVPVASAAERPKTDAGRRGRAKPLIATVIAGLVALGIGGYLVMSLQSGTSGSGAGADSPEAAVRQLIASADNEDLLGMLGSLDPSEVEPLERLYTSLTRVGGDQVGVAFGEGGLLDGVAIEVGFAADAAELVSTPDRSDDSVALVELDSLRVQLTRTDTPPPAVALISTEFEDAIAWSAGEFRPGAGISVELRRAGSATDVTVEVDGETRFLEVEVALDVVTVRRDGRWFVSPGATVIAAVFELLDLDRPRYGEWREVLDDPRAGADAPDRAVESLIESAVDFDIEEALQFIDPTQNRLAHDMWPAVREVVDERWLADENARLRPSVTALELEFAEVEGETRVSIQRLGVRADDFGRTIDLEFDGWCADIRDDFDGRRTCLDEFFAEWFSSAIAPIGYGLPQLEGLLPRDLYLVVEQRGDRWFVSPLGTLASWMESIAAEIEAGGELPDGYYGYRFVAASPALPGAEVSAQLDGDPVVFAVSVPAESYFQDDGDQPWFDRRLARTDFAVLDIQAEDGLELRVGRRSAVVGPDGLQAVFSPDGPVGRTVAVSAFDGRGELRIAVHEVEPAVARSAGTYEIPLTPSGVGVLAFDIGETLAVETSSAAVVERSYFGNVDVLGDGDEIREVQGSGYLVVSDPGATTTEVTLVLPAPRPADPELVIGTIFPVTGDLAFLGPPEVAAAELAVADINDAGGVLGTPVVLLQGDSGDTTTNLATREVERLLAAEADVIVGAASSAVSMTVIDRITGAGVIQFSPANASAEFTTYDDNGLYFRTSPSDVLQGRVLADLVLRDGNATASVVFRQDQYGQVTADAFRERFDRVGGAVDEFRSYPGDTQSFESIVDEIAAAGSDAVVLIGFGESAVIVTAMHERGVGPTSATTVYGVDGNIGGIGRQLPDPSILAGMRGIQPAVDLAGIADFTARLDATGDMGGVYAYGAETYDAIVVVALAAEAAGSVAPGDIAAEINDVTRGGERCTDFTSCRNLISAGADIDYDGLGGPYEFDDSGEPTAASYLIATYDGGVIPNANLDEYVFAS